MRCSLRVSGAWPHKRSRGRGWRHSSAPPPCQEPPSRGPRWPGGEGRGGWRKPGQVFKCLKISLCRQPFGERRPQKETCLFEVAADDPNPTFSADYLFLSFPSWTRLAASQMPRVPAACPGNLSFNELRQLALKMRRVPWSERGKRQQPPFALWMITSHAYYFPP